MVESKLFFKNIKALQIDDENNDEKDEKQKNYVTIVTIYQTRFIQKLHGINICDMKIVKPWL